MFLQRVEVCTIWGQLGGQNLNTFLANQGEIIWWVCLASWDYSGRLSLKGLQIGGSIYVSAVSKDCVTTP